MNGNEEKRDSYSEEEDKYSEYESRYGDSGFEKFRNKSATVKSNFDIKGKKKWKHRQNNVIEEFA